MSFLPGMPDFDALGKRAETFAGNTEETLGEIAATLHATNFLLAALVQAAPGVSAETLSHVKAIVAAERDTMLENAARDVRHD